MASSSSSVLKIWGCLHSSSSSTNNTSISSPFTSILSLTSSPSPSSSSSSILSWSLHQSRLDGSRPNLRTHAKFEKFQGEEEKEIPNTQSNLDQSVSSSSLVTQDQPVEEIQEDEVEEDDSCLPSNLEGAVRQSSEAAAEFVCSGGMRAIVELLIPQLEFLDDEGAQGELWELSRIFLDSLIEETGCEKVKAIFPDAGAAALLKYRWQDAVFGFSSLSDRKPVESEDEIVVMVVPDFQMLEYVQRISTNLSDDPPRPLIMWNPRLVSQDVGVGFNVRNLRRYFLRTFTTVYSMRPLPSGAVYRCYPGSWKVFYDDKDRPNRYLLAKEQISRPDADELEIIFGDVEEKTEKGPSLFGRGVASMFSSMSRFMKIISR